VVKPLLRLAVTVVGVGVAGLFLLPVLVAAVVAGRLQQVSQLAAAWDIPPEVAAALQEAGQQAAVPWFLLAGVASVATDFARHAPDGIARGGTAGSATFPVVVPPIAAGAGAGMFLVDANPEATVSGAAALADPQDVADAANWLARRLAALAVNPPASEAPLDGPSVGQYWEAVLAAAPLVIASPAPTGSSAAASAPAEGTPIREFGGDVLANIGAPVTDSNLGAFAAWAAGENTCAQFNPLATTQPEPGATPFNTLQDGGHVWNYPTLAVGVQATTAALTNGRYQPVIAAFQADAGEAAVASAVESSPWGTHSFGSPTYAGRQCRGPSPTPATTPSLPTVTGPDAVVATIVARAAVYQAIWEQLEQLTPDTTASTPPVTTPVTTVF
jgi:hypothetical protein